MPELPHRHLFRTDPTAADAGPAEGAGSSQSAVLLTPFVCTPGTAPILAEGIELYSNPLPHVLILTAIVVGVATTALGLALVVRIRNAFGSIEDEEIDELENQT